MTGPPPSCFYLKVSTAFQIDAEIQLVRHSAMKHSRVLCERRSEDKRSEMQHSTIARNALPSLLGFEAGPAANQLAHALPTILPAWRGELPVAPAFLGVCPARLDNKTDSPLPSHRWNCLPLAPGSWVPIR